jgi:alpha-methylacyl-CoA racemase
LNAGPALAGTVVLSVGHTLPGVYCLAMLRDLGAEVVRIERVARGGGAAGPYAALSRDFPTRSLMAGTHSLGLDLKNDAGRATFRRLADTAAVVVEGFRPGVAARLGIDYARLCEGHEALVYASISGHGQQGPASARVGHDVNYLAETGVLALANPIGLPGTTFADGLAGVSAALNVVAALHAATRSGRGQHLDLAIIDGPAFLMASELEVHRRGGEPRGAGGTHLTGRHPWYAVHRTRDGGHVAVGAVEPEFYRALCRALGHPELETRQFAEGAELEQAWAAFASAFASRTRDEAIALCDGVDACVSPVRSTAEAAGAPELARTTRAGSAHGETLVRTPVRLPPAPLAAERRDAELLARFGFTPEQVEELVRAGALARGPGAPAS